MEFDDYWAYSKAVETVTRTGRELTGVAIFGAASTLIGAICWLFGDEGWGSPLLFCLGLYALSMLLVRPLRQKWYFRKAKTQLRDWDIAVNHEGLTTTSETSHHVFRWDAIPKLVDSPNGLLFVGIFDHPIAWISQKAFPAGGSRAEILGAASRHGVKIVRLSAE